MDEIVEYLENAELCLQLAVNARTETVRANVIELAKQWTKLAAERENIERLKTSPTLTPARIH